MSDNKTKPTNVDVETFLQSVSESRRDDAHKLIAMMREISGESPVMWGPSIIGFGSEHYKYASGREGDMPHLGFSPRKASLTIYFNRGFDSQNELLEKLGKFKTSVSCLYINKLTDVDLDVLREMLEKAV